MVDVSHSPILTSAFRHADSSPDKTAVVTTDGTEISYSDLRLNILKAARWLSENGISHGDRLMISTEKEVEFVYLYLAAHLIGAVNVVVDAQNNAAHLQYIADAVKPLIAVGFKFEGIPSFSYDGIGLPEQVANDCLYSTETAEESSRLSPEDTADIMFTSGTTGNPKGVVLSHANIAGSAENINSFIGNSAEDVELLGLPVCHSFGLGRLRCNLLTGATIVLHNGFANLKSVFSAFEKYGVTGFGMVPAVWAYIRRFSGNRITRYAPQMKYIEIGSAALPREDKQLLSELFPSTRICMHYGLTEASRSAFIEFHSDAGHLDSAGKRVSDKVDIRIFGSDGKEMPLGDTGEICIKGNMVTEGYLDSAQNNEAFFGSYFRTGDGGRMDKDGYVYLADRIKEIINVGGKKVSPVEIEETVKEIAGAESVCMAAADPDGILGEVPRLLILKDSLRMDMEELKSRLRERLETYKYPRLFELTESLPLTANGKKKHRMN